jgi:hypothetical protein
MNAPKPDVVAVYNAETCECVLAEDYKRAIRDAIPSGICLLDAFWRELADIVSKFYIKEKCRTNRRRPAAEIKRWQKIAELVVTDEKPTDPQAVVKAQAERQVAAYQMVAGDYKGKRNRSHEALYMWVLEDLWCKGLGLNLGVSSVGKKVPGPLIKFFAACVNPLLPKPLTAKGIVTIVDRAKARQKSLQKWRERTKRAKDQT